MYMQVSKMIIKNNDEYTGEMMSQMGQTISNSCRELQNIMISIAYDSVVQEYLTEKDQYGRIKLFYDLNNNIINVEYIKDGILDFIISGDNGVSYFYKGKNDDIVKVLDSMPEHANQYYTAVETLEYDGIERKCFILASDFYAMNNKILGNKIGRVAIVIDCGVLGAEPDKDIGNSASKFYLTDRKGFIYSGNDRVKLYSEFPLPEGQESGTIKINNELFIMHSQKIPEFGGRIISTVPKNKLFGDMIRIRSLMIIIIIIGGVPLIVLFTVLISNILQPLNKFLRYIAAIKAGNLKGLRQRIGLEGYAEIKIMADEFNSLLAEINSLTHNLLSTSSRMYELELQKKQSEISQLKSQINPHFLYNTLESMKGVAIDENARKIFDMIDALGQIFNYSVKGADIVAVRDELEIIKSYVRIQQIRFEDRFVFRYDIRDDALDCYIPKMTLQPIVENAVFHGLEEKLEMGWLWIEGEICNGTDLRISIRDNGVGIDAETLAGIQASLSGNPVLPESNTNKNSNIGLLNVNNRIKLMYGADYGIEIKSVLDQGSEVIIRIPFRRDLNA